MDINLPEMSGIEALEKLKLIDETRNIPVIAVSANAMKDEVDKAMAAGFIRYIIKPINITNFVKTINEILNDNKG
jgi:CheY-like chemotaxis protein